MAKKKNFPLRIDPKLYDVLQVWAKDEFRSVNSHVEFLLREAAKKSGRLSGHDKDTKEGSDR
ncbi:toxin-antitoxin system HicB family antitoxin [Aquibacillus koreensis]|uniref:Toxin-antitoxin system HicB family antitoxin n=1 Tax=Aquibacillus koreensis TaxID=279446 RepID=A0A9X3WR85_9BACI|nr:toxin-antitoxin system HicB family antitoxin [Aquibacillus koreensis]MCT2536225.1 toxin-antitoxin system HicB family antitoxin [Aquibacillus koreensis]MDC3422221.1 toxin-antitoxin system HicB family antitoxin [Aquibacillus koreensis]